MGFRSTPCGAAHNYTKHHKQINNQQ